MADITITPSVLPVAANLLATTYRVDMTVFPSVSSISVSLSSPADVTDNKTTVMNAKTLAVTQYVNFNYNSYTFFNGKHIALNKTGVFELGGDDDNGSDISASLKTGTIDTYGENINRLEDGYLTFRSDGDVVLKTVGDETDERSYTITNSISGLIHERRIKFQKRLKNSEGIRNRYFSFELSNVSGSSLDIDKLRIAMEPIRKRR